MIDISVIVPAYNAENYIKTCLNSLINQTKKEIEIIVINDGSTDNTLDILNEYKNKYGDAIKVISQKNQGLSVTRNNGIKIAQGKYVAFVDSDDYIKDNMLEILFNKAIEKDYDVVVCNVDCIYPKKVSKISSGITFNSNNLSAMQKKEMFLNMYVAVWNKLYKRELFDDENISFEPNIWFEDVLFFHKIIPKIKSIAFVNEYLYKYVQRENSITYTYSNKLNDIKFVLENILKYYKENNLFEKYKDELEYMYVRYMFATYIKRLAKSKDKERFLAGVEDVKQRVNDNFPNYKKNVYINKDGLKNFYLKHFNNKLANIVYYIEKNKMN